MPVTGKKDAEVIGSNNQLLITNHRGALRPNADIGRNTWFQVGGPAEWLFKPEDAEDLAEFLKHKPAGLPITVIGVGSNLLVRDGGVEGVVIRLGRGFTDIRVEPEGKSLTVGAACLDIHVAESAAEHGIGGLEFLAGIPGTIGGGVAMNAGAYGGELADALVAVDLVTAEGARRRMSGEELKLTYRHAELPAGAIIVSATLQGWEDAPEAIRARIAEIQKNREDTQPVRSKTGGSTFKNPPGQKAWELIDRAGCRGLKVGGAMVSEKHCNFLINSGSATALDLETLGEEVRNRVRNKCGVELEWEIKRIGHFTPPA